MGRSLVGRNFATVLRIQYTTSTRSRSNNATVLEYSYYYATTYVASKKGSVGLVTTMMMMMAVTKFLSEKGVYY